MTTCKARRGTTEQLVLLCTALQEGARGLGGGAHDVQPGTVAEELMLAQFSGLSLIDVRNKLQ